MAAFRYMVNDVGESVDFYVQNLGFELCQQYGAAMAILRTAGHEVWLAGPASSAAKAMPDRRVPTAGGWARIVLQVADLDEMVSRLRSNGVSFRNQIISGPGGRQVLIDDPSGNYIELFQSA